MIFRLPSCFSLSPKPAAIALKFYFRSYLYFSHCFIFISHHIYPALQVIIRNFLCVKHIDLVGCRLTALSFVKHEHFIFLQIWKFQSSRVPSKNIKKAKLLIFFSLVASKTKKIGNFSSISSLSLYILLYCTTSGKTKETIVFLSALSKQSVFSHMRKQNNCFEKLCFWKPHYSYKRTLVHITISSSRNEWIYHVIRRTGNSYNFEFTMGQTSILCFHKFSF